MARATDSLTRDAVLVAHGSPSDPAAQDEAMAALADAVMAHAPGWRVRGATLAADGSLDSALAGLHDPLIYPFFMAEGFFTTQVLPARLARIGAPVRQLPAFGMDTSLPAMIAEAACTGALAHGLAPARTALLLAAHGSQVSSASRRRTLELARLIRAATPFRAVATGFIEEEPYLADAAQDLGQALCLPLFTLKAGHVEEDVPQALASAGFDGPVLPHIGAHAGVPALIAAALAREARRIAA